MNAKLFAISLKITVQIPKFCLSNLNIRINSVISITLTNWMRVFLGISYLLAYT